MEHYPIENTMPLLCVCKYDQKTTKLYPYK